jgi:hypothetical protein
MHACVVACSSPRAAPHKRDIWSDFGPKIEAFGRRFDGTGDFHSILSMARFSTPQLGRPARGARDAQFLGIEL